MKKKDVQKRELICKGRHGIREEKGACSTWKKVMALNGGCVTKKRGPLLRLRGELPSI